MSPDTICSLLTLAIGFATAGLTASAYQALTARPLSFRLTMQPARGAALMAVPLLVFAAPFLILRSILCEPGRAQGRAGFVALATILAGLWSLLSGAAVALGWSNLIRLLG